jgi:predicted ATPase
VRNEERDVNAPDFAERSPAACTLSGSTGALVQALVTALAADVLAGVDERVRAVVREEMRRGAAVEAEWVSTKQAAALTGYGASTIRRWKATRVLTPGRGGRVNLAQLRAVVANGGAPAPARPGDLAAERARRLAATIAKRGA